MHIDEVWHFENRVTGLFREYINTFLKIKTEASGWPANCVTEEQRAQFIKEFYEREGVKLDPAKMILNPGLRALAKLKLNSLWGRLGMRDDKSKTEFVTDPARFNELLLSGKFNVQSFDLLSDEVMGVQFRVQENFDDVNPSTNVILAAFTTSLARLHLYQFMEKLGSNLLYCDTDSVIFKHKPGDYMPPTGNYLGALTSELKPDQWIVSFCSLGPKCYGWLSNDGQHTSKIKGHTINGETKELLNFETLLRLLSDGSVENIRYSRVLRRVKKHLTIFQTDQTKRLQFTFDKRVIVDEEFNTLPYGY